MPPQIDTVGIFLEMVNHDRTDPAELAKFVEQATLLIHPECEWTLVPFNTTFRGADEIRKYLGTDSQASRQHPTNAFVSGDKFCGEWTSHGTVAETSGLFDEWGLGEFKGKSYDVKLCLVAELKDGRFYHVREYFDPRSGFKN
jgi:SnoaL-like domain